MYYRVSENQKHLAVLTSYMSWKPDREQACKNFSIRLGCFIGSRLGQEFYFRGYVFGYTVLILRSWRHLSAKGGTRGVACLVSFSVNSAHVIVLD